MPHPVVYPGNFDALLKEWEEKAKQAWNEHGQAGLNALKIADGECARLPQELTSVGILMFDQWNSRRAPKWPSPRPVRVWPEAIARDKKPSDKADEFFVVLVQ